MQTKRKYVNLNIIILIVSILLNCYLTIIHEQSSTNRYILTITQLIILWSLPEYILKLAKRIRNRVLQFIIATFTFFATAETTLFLTAAIFFTELGGVHETHGFYKLYGAIIFTLPGIITITFVSLIFGFILGYVSLTEFETIDCSNE